MRIKKLEVQGFKSFVDKTVFNFPMGLTAIVGPNGCGKSNIVDAIRWVLGEHNARHLRGKHMEDVIFNGSEVRKPHGMAEAILTLLNEEGNAPAAYVDFSEIEVARRLYRSGESEYYINKVQCRLKDIVDLFTDTGIGTRAYSIIEQGQVGWLVNAKPEERRVLFEEAAGINRYKHRKEISLRRLDSTKQNLLRVNDIISEVKRQMNSLDRQAKKAEKYKKFREELREVELFLTKRRYGVLNDERLKILKKMEDLDRELTSVSTQISVMEGLLEKARTSYLNEEDELKRIKEKAFDVISAINSREREIELNDLRIQELTRRIDDRLTEVESLKRQIGDAVKEKDVLEKEIEDLNGSISVGEESLKDAETRVKILSDELAVKDGRLKEEKEKLVDMLTRLTQIRGMLQSCLKDEDMLRLKTGRLRREKHEIDKLILGRVECIRDIEGKIAGVSSSRSGLEKESETTLSILEGLNGELSAKEDNIKALKEELAAVTSRLDMLEELNRGFDSFSEGVKAIMLNVGNRGGLAAEGIRGVLADCLQVPRKYEKAVESALGCRLQYILVQDVEIGKRAIGHLKANRSGRCTFLATHGMEGGVSCNRGEDVPGRGAPPEKVDMPLNHISVGDEYLPIVEDLLRDVLLADDLEEAIDIWTRYGGAKVVVTMDGDVVDSDGSITGGWIDDKGGGILKRKREVRELADRSGVLREDLRRIESEREVLEGELRESRKRLESLREETHAKIIDLVNLEAALKRERVELERFEDRIKVLDFEIREGESELKDISEKKAGLMKERESLESSQRSAEDSMALLSSEVEGLMEKRDAALDSLTEGKVALASLRERLEGLKAKYASNEAFLGEVDVRLKDRLDSVDQAKSRIDELSSTGVALKEGLEALIRRKDEVHGEEVMREDTITSLSGRIDELETKLKGLRGDRDTIERDKNALSLSYREAELGLQHLEERAIERYGIPVEVHEPAAWVCETPEDLLKERYEELRDKMQGMGEVSLSALEEYAELNERYNFLLNQQADLQESMDDLYKAINKINRTTRERFRETYEAVNLKFKDIFPSFFRGGEAELRLSDEGNLLESGIEIVAQPPGKRLQNIGLLSGGEKAMTATALIFSIFSVKPSPFCLLDEVDAPLDDANIDRFNGFLREMSDRSQFILITHNKHTMEMVDTLFGITMEEAGVSKVVSVQFA